MDVIYKIQEIPFGYTLLDGSVSGGDFRTYLVQMLQECAGKICLYLAPMKKRFSLPCRNGQGTDVSNEDITYLLNIYNPAMCTALCMNYLFIADSAEVILFDTEETILLKKRIAEDVGVPFVYIKK